MFEALMHSLINAKVAELPIYTCQPCDQATVYLCSDPAQIPLLNRPHAALCLAVPLTGRLCLAADDQKLDCCPERFLVLGENWFHAWSADDRTANSGQTRRLLVAVYDHSHVSEAAQACHSEPVSLASCRSVLQLGPCGLMIVHFMLMICKDHPGSSRLMSLTANLLLLYHWHCIVQASSPAAPQPTAAADTMIRSYRYLMDRLEEKICIKQLAEQSGYSAQQYQRLFKQQFGICPYRMLVLARLQHAMQLLQVGDEPIGTVCRKCGFQSHSRFSALFRRETGLSPSSYRVQMRQAETGKRTPLAGTGPASDGS